MKIPPVKGTRDLYPELLAPIRRIFDVWRRVSIRHGFEEFEGPTLEHLDLYREKSGEELVGQLYRLTDSGGRELALRPEMTPTLARMVAAKINALPKPIKWFCISTLFRGENVQRGRLREFYQWNVDVIGTGDVAADAEVILVGVEALRELGLSAADFAVHISNRRLIAAMLSAAGIPDEQHAGAYALMDKFGKLDPVEWDRRWDAAYGSHLLSAQLRGLMSSSDLDELASLLKPSAGGTAATALELAMKQTKELMTILDNFGITEFCRIDLRVVRGLAYYTGPVFEFYDRSEKERAICGGGRYDDLLGKLGDSRDLDTPTGFAVGFGMGDVVLSLLLKEKGLLKQKVQRCDVFVIDADVSQQPTLHKVVAALRREGYAAEFSYRTFIPREIKSRQLDRAKLNRANKKGARVVVLLGDDPTKPQLVRIKQMAGGQVRDVSLDELLKNPKQILEQGG